MRHLEIENFRLVGANHGCASLGTLSADPLTFKIRARTLHLATAKNVLQLCIFQGIKSGKKAQNFDKCQGKSHGFLLKSQGKSGKFFLRGLSEPCIYNSSLF